MERMAPKTLGSGRVTDPVLLLDAEGDEFRAERVAVALRGGSTNEPFCEGTHSKAGFRVVEGQV